jgi:hypothetical protein
MSPGGFELMIPARARPQTYALDRAATGIGVICLYDYTFRIITCSSYKLQIPSRTHVSSILISCSEVIVLTVIQNYSLLEYVTALC